MFGLKSDYCPLLTLIITLEALATDIDLYDQLPLHLRMEVN